MKARAAVAVEAGHPLVIEEIDVAAATQNIQDVLGGALGGLG